LKNLEIFLARDNKIEAIDVTEEGLGGLKLLATLDLANNDIAHCPPTLGNMTQIK
jgi:Leucine-rich repeat (LRR) protein